MIDNHNDNKYKSCRWPRSCVKSLLALLETLIYAAYQVKLQFLLYLNGSLLVFLHQFMVNYGNGNLTHASAKSTQSFMPQVPNFYQGFSKTYLVY